MENQKKENVKVEVKKDVAIPFKRSFELSLEEINKLPKVLCQLEHGISKKGFSFYNMTMRFDGKDYNYKLKVKQDKFGEAQYNHFIRKNNLDPKKLQHVKLLPIRFLKGINVNNEEYKMYQVFLSDKITITDYLSFFDQSELEDIGYKYDCVENPQKVVEEQVQEF